MSTRPRGVYHSPANGPRHRDQPGTRPGGCSRPACGRAAGRRLHRGHARAGSRARSISPATRSSSPSPGCWSRSSWSPTACGRAPRRACAWAGGSSPAGSCSSSRPGTTVPYVGLVVGALAAAGVGLAMRRVRAGAVKAGGDVRGTALIEDGARPRVLRGRRHPLRRLRAGGRRRVAAPAPAPARRPEVPRPARAAMSAASGPADGEEADPGRRRRPRARPARPCHRRRARPHDRRARGRRRAPRRLRLDVPVAHPRLPVGASDRRASGRVAHPRHELVPPRRAAPGRVRLVVCRHARRGHPPDGRRHPREPEPGAPLAAGDHDLRGARGRRPRHGGR